PRHGRGSGGRDRPHACPNLGRRENAGAPVEGSGRRQPMLPHLPREPPGGRAVAMLTDEQAAAIAAYYPALTPSLVREVVAAPPSAADDWQGWAEAAPAWQIADRVMVALWRRDI